MSQKILDHKALSDIHSQVTEMLMLHGFKATTMDAVAAKLGISKRTLYEIFGSKDQMLRESLEAQAQLHQAYINDIIKDSQNAMEGLIKAFRYHHHWLDRANVNFFRDLDRLYSHIRKDYDREYAEREKQFLRYIDRGVSEGVFRKDIDHRIYLKLMNIQMESLKRMEENFPPDITIPKATEYIILGFLRSLATEKGMKMIEECAANTLFNTNNNIIKD